MLKLIKLPKWLRVPSPVDLGKAKYNALPMKNFGNPTNAYSWDEWKEEVQAKYPIRYFLFETVPFKFSVKIQKPIKEAIYWVQCKLFKKYKYHLVDIRNLNYGHESLSEYKYGYCDPLNQILYASFAILSSHVEDGNPAAQIKYIKEAWEKNENIYGSIEADKERLAIYETIMDLYDWWNIRRPLLLKQYDNALHNDSNKPKNLDYHNKYKGTNAAEELIKNEERESLKKLADVREYLWN